MAEVDPSRPLGDLVGSRSALWRATSAALGMSPKRFLMLRRLGHGMNLLGAGQRRERCRETRRRVEFSDREMHPDTDELLMVLNGSFSVEIPTVNHTDSERHSLSAGRFVVLQRG